MDRIKKVGLFSIGISNATLAELYFGAYSSGYVELNLINILQFRKNLTVYSDSNDSAENFGKIKTMLKQTGNVRGGVCGW